MGHPILFLNCNPLATASKALYTVGLMKVFGQTTTNQRNPSKEPTLFNPSPAHVELRKQANHITMNLY